jgi:hypothetical protein
VEVQGVGGGQRPEEAGRRVEPACRLSAAGEQHVLVHQRAQPQAALVESGRGEGSVEAHGVAAHEQHQHGVGVEPLDAAQRVREVVAAQR